MAQTREIADPAVRRTFESFPERHRNLALKLGARILTASSPTSGRA